MENPLVNATKYLKVKTDTLQQVRITYPRASSIMKACLRLHIIAMHNVLYRQDKNTALPQRMALSLGNALHYWIQNQPDFYGDDRRGWWKCLACEKVPYFGKPPGPGYHCPFCGASYHAFEYKEHPMVIKGNPFYGSGHPDLFLAETKKVSDEWVMTNELKSIKNGQNDKWDWDNIIEPLAEHKYQVMMYLLGLKHDPILKQRKIKVIPSQANISYIAKGNFGNKLPIKTFTIEAKQHKDIAEDILQRLSLFKQGFEDYPKSIVPVLSVCKGSEFSHYEARNCPGLDICRALNQKGF